MTPELKLMKDQIKDWSTWTPCGGRMWYDTCTKPDGFVFQLGDAVGKLINMHEFFQKSQDRCKAVYQLTRKMSDDAGELYQRLSEPGMGEVVVQLQENIQKNHPEMKDCYNLIEFIACQEAYLKHLTNMFHNVVENNIAGKVVAERLTFYSDLHAMICVFVDVVEAVHIVNKIDERQKKAAFKEFEKHVNSLVQFTAGWDVNNIQLRFTVSEETRKMMETLFKYDIETNALTEETVDLVRHIVKRAKVYKDLVKDVRYQANHNTEFWKNFKTLVINDGSSDTAKDK